MRPIAILSRSLSMGKIRLVHQAALTALISAVAGAALAQTGSTEIPPTAARQFPAMGPTRELKLAENTWFRFGFQVQAWVKAAQDRIMQPDGSDGSFAVDMYCRRCRIFATGSIVKDVTFNLLLEAGNLGKGNVATGDKGFGGPAPVVSLLDAYGMIKFADPFFLSASNNPPRVIAMMAYNFWDTEKGYVNGGHYYGTKKVLGIMGNFDYQTFRKVDPPIGGVAGGVGKNPYFGGSAAVFINYPLSGRGDPKGGDEIVALAQFGYYDGGVDPTPGSTNQPTYPAILRQADFLYEAAYYNKDLKLSFFGKFELRKINAIYSTAVRAAGNQMWIAGGLKYYVAPANLR